MQTQVRPKHALHDTSILMQDREAFIANSYACLTLSLNFLWQDKVQGTNLSSGFYGGAKKSVLSTSEPLQLDSQLNFFG